MTLDPVAVYAAVVSTTAIVWDVIKWRRERTVSLKGFATPNMIAAGGAITPLTRGKKYIRASVSNYATMPCMIQQTVILAYPNFLARWRGKSSFSAIVLDPMTTLTGKRLPYKLEPGDEFSGLCEQTRELEELSRSKLLYVGVCHSLAQRPFLLRVPPIKAKTDDMQAA
jgi:hypothetical protein